MNELSGVRTGVTLILYQIILSLVLILFSIVGGMIAASTRDIENVVLFLNIVNVFSVGLSILAITGRIMCMSAPAETEGKNFIITAVVFDLIAMLFVLSFYIDLVSEQTVRIGGLFNLIAHILFLMFLKKVALYINRSELADKSQGVLNLMGALFISMVAMLILAFTLPVLMLVPGIAVIVLGILLFIRYIGLIVGMKAALERATGV